MTVSSAGKSLQPQGERFDETETSISGAWACNLIAEMSKRCTSGVSLMP